MKKTLAAAVAIATIAAIAVPGQASVRRSRPAKFAAPVKLTPTGAGGYEPSVQTDKFGNVYVTAHKENAELVLSPDSQSPTMTRSMSWKWMSSDDGRTFAEIPGLPLNAENHDFGDEGDMAVDQANHLYFVDTNVADVTFTRWTISGRGALTQDIHRPVLPAAQPVDDRPWIAAHGQGNVYYLGNEGDKATYPLGAPTATTGASGENIGGRYTLYESHDAGQTFNPTGKTLADSGWCRPDADPRSTYVYVVCTDDGGSNDVTPLDTANDTGNLYMYVSPDDAKTWKRYTIGTYLAHDPTPSWPTMQVAPDGSLYVLYMDAASVTRMNDATTGPSYKANGNRLYVFRSTNHGKTWARQDVTPQSGDYTYGWISVAKDSKTLGLTAYHRSQDKKWRIYATLFKYGTIPTWTSLDEANPVAGEKASPPGDYISCRFGPDGALSVVWTRVTIRADSGKGAGASVFRDIFYARSITRAPLK